MLIVRALAAMVLGLSAMLGATIGSAALTGDWVWLAEWMVPVAGIATGALCFAAPTGVSAWARGFVMAGAIYSAAAAALYIAPGAVMKDGGEAVADIAGAAGKQARERSAGDSQAQRAAEGAVTGAVVGLMGFVGVAFGVVLLFGAALLAGGLHLMAALIMVLVGRREPAAAKTG